MCKLVYIVVVSLVSLHIFKVSVAKKEPSDENGYVAASESGENKEGQKTEHADGQKASRLDSKLKGVKDKAQGIAGKMYKRAHGKEGEDSFFRKVGGFLANVGETLRQNAYEKAGNLYDRVDPMRFYWGKSWKVIRTISFEKLSKKEQLNTMVDAMTEEITQLVPPHVEINPIEVDNLPIKYICGDKGLIHDLKSIKHVGTRTKKEGDMVTIYITYKFQTLYFTYDTFYINIINVLRLNGKLVINYKDNDVTLILGVPNVSRLLWNILKKNCILHVLNFQVGSLDYDNCEIIANSNFRKDQARGLIDQYLKDNGEDLRKNFETTVLIEIHRALAATGAWICKDSAIAEEVEKRGGTLEEFVAKTKFRANCRGENSGGWFGR